MAFRPRTGISKCPGCGSSNQKVKCRGIFYREVRLECSCGVSGCWEHWSYDGMTTPQSTADEGWRKAFPEKEELTSSDMIRAFKFAFHKSHEEGNGYDVSIRLALQAAFEVGKNVIDFSKIKPLRPKRD